MPKRQVTLADIAKELNISTATVSRALKDYPDISDKTKARVIALVKEWKYRPNTIAAGLRKQESNTIGVIVPEIVNHFFSGVIKGIMQVAYEANFRVMICQSDESKEKEIKDANALFESRVDGLLVSLAHETDEFDHFYQFKEAGVPVVLFDKISEQVDSSTVTADDYSGALETVEHLIQQGAKRIAHFGGPLIASTSQNRYQGYLDALAKYGLENDPSLVCTCNEITMEEGKEFGKQILEMAEPPDAIFAVTDSVALGAVVAARELGVKVPEDLMVAGFSDWKISAVFNPSLTTVSQPSFEMGKKSAELLLEEIRQAREEEETQKKTIVLPTKMIVRETTARK